MDTHIQIDTMSTDANSDMYRHTLRCRAIQIDAGTSTDTQTLVQCTHRHACVQRDTDTHVLETHMHTQAHACTQAHMHPHRNTHMHIQINILTEKHGWGTHIETHYSDTITHACTHAQGLTICSQRPRRAVATPTALPCLGCRSPTCRSLRPSTGPRLRRSWCTRSCCGGRWMTSPAEVRGPAGRSGG